MASAGRRRGDSRSVPRCRTARPRHAVRNRDWPPPGTATWRWTGGRGGRDARARHHDGLYIRTTTAHRSGSPASHGELSPPRIHVTAPPHQVPELGGGPRRAGLDLAGALFRRGVHPVLRAGHRPLHEASQRPGVVMDVGDDIPAGSPAAPGTVQVIVAEVRERAEEQPGAFVHPPAGRFVRQAGHLGCLLQSRASRAAMSARSAFLSILPTLVAGSSGTTTSRSGHLKRATSAFVIAARTASRVSAAPGIRTA